MSDLEQIFAPLAVADLQLNAGQAAVALGLYRELAKGTPVSREGLVSELRISMPDVNDALDSDALNRLVLHDDQQAIIGFGGLAVMETAHRFVVRGTTLFTWCAWDALFIPELLNETAEVESNCPQTGKLVRLTAAPDGVQSVDPAETVLSFVSPDELRIEQTAAGTMKSFCHRVHFLASPLAGREWTDRHKGTFLLSMEDGFTLAKKFNDWRFGSELTKFLSP